jgi:hypothetical protein
MVRAETSPPRHELPEIDAAALVAAQAADDALRAAREMGSERWERYLEQVPDRLRDDPLSGVRATAQRVRAAYGPKDSIRDALPEAVTEPLLRATDRLIKVVRRWEANLG